MDNTSGERHPRLPARVLVVGAALLVALAVAIPLWRADSSGDPDDPNEAAESAASASVSRSGSAPSRPTSTALPHATVTPPRTTRGTKRGKFGETVGLGNGVTVRVSKIEAVRGVARGAGEVAGPALRLTLQVHNGSDSPMDLELALANAYSGVQHSPATALSGPGVKAFPVKLGPGRTGKGVYVFGVAPADRDRVTVEFTYSAQAPRVVFAGAVD